MMAHSPRCWPATQPVVVDAVHECAEHHRGCPQGLDDLLAPVQHRQPPSRVEHGRRCDREERSLGVVAKQVRGLEAPSSERLTSLLTVGIHLRKRRSAQREAATYSHGGSETG
jgi:hypothetical protein